MTSHIWPISDFSISCASGSALYGAECTGSPVLGLVQSDVWRYLLVAIGRPTLFQIVPSHFGIYYDIRQIFVNRNFLTRDVHLFLSISHGHLFMSLISCSLKLWFFVVNRLLPFLMRVPTPHKPISFQGLFAACNEHIVMERYRPFWKVCYQYPKWSIFSNCTNFTCRSLGLLACPSVLVQLLWVHCKKMKQSHEMLFSPRMLTFCDLNRHMSLQFKTKDLARKYAWYLG